MLIFLLISLSIESYSQKQNGDTIRFENVLVSKIISKPLKIFDDKKKDAYINTIKFKKNNMIISINYRGQAPFYFNKEGKGSLITIGNTVDCYLKTGESYHVELIRQCGVEDLKYTFYNYYAIFDKTCCSKFTMPSRITPLAGNTLFYYNHYFVDWNSHLYKIKIVDCTDVIK